MADDSGVKDPQQLQVEGEAEEVEEPKFVQLVIKVPGQGDRLSISFSEEETLSDLKSYLLETPETCTFTNYTFCCDGQRLPDTVPLNELTEVVEKKEPVLEMVEDTYDEKSARYHFRRVRDLLNHSSVETYMPTTVFTDLNNEQLAYDGMKEDKNGDTPLLAQFYPKNSTTLPKCIARLALSGWNPPPPNRRLQGDLFYIDVTTLEGESFVVTASSRGFYINQSKNTVKFDPAPRGKTFTTLPALLSSVSPRFASSFAELARGVFDRNPLFGAPLYAGIPLPWAVKQRPHDYDIGRAEDFASFNTVIEINGLGGQERDLNEEYQLAFEMPRETHQDRLARDHELYRKHTEFIDAVSAGAIAILNGSVPPLNPADEKKLHIFTYNNIFFCFASDSRDLYKDFGGDATAYKAASNDLLGQKILSDIGLTGLSLVPYAVVDYRGHRLIAQCMIPGLFDALQKDESSVVQYGLLNDKRINTDETFHSLLQNHAKALHLQEHKVKDAEGKVVSLVASPDLKGVMARDKRRYLVEATRLTPRDANYREPHHIACLLRPELIANYIAKKTREIADKRVTEKLKAKEDAKTPEQREADRKALETKRKEDPIAAALEEREEYLKLLQEEDIEAPDLRFNVDLLVPNVELADDEATLKEQEELLNELARYLREECIPIAVMELRELTMAVDGVFLTQLLHQNGVNMRYLGLVMKHVQKLCPIYRDLVMREMVVRALKPLWSEAVSNVPEHELAQTIASFLNAYFGRVSNNPKGTRSGLPLVTGEKVSSTSLFNHDGLWARIRENVEKKFQYTLPEFIPTTMFDLPTLRYICIKLGIRLETKNYDLNAEKPFEASNIADLQPVIKHHPPINVESSELLLAGKRLLQDGRLDVALQFLQEACDTSAAVYGLMHRDTAHCHSQVAMVYYHANQFEDAYQHQLQATITSERVNGLDHFETVQAYGNLALYAHQCGHHKVALNFIKRSIYLSHLLTGWPSIEHIHSYMNLGNMLQENQDLQAAIHYFTKALTISENLNGSSHQLTGTLCHFIAMAHAANQNYRQALNYEKRSNQIFTQVFGPKHQRTVESNILLQTYTQQAVQFEREKKAPTSKPARGRQAEFSMPNAPAIKPATASMGELPIADLLKYINTPSNRKKGKGPKPKQKPTITKLSSGTSAQQKGSAGAKPTTSAPAQEAAASGDAKKKSKKKKNKKQNKSSSSQDSLPDLV